MSRCPEHPSKRPRVGRHVLVLLALVAVASLGLSCQPMTGFPRARERGIDREGLARGMATLRDIPGVLQVTQHGARLYVYTTEPSKVPQSIEEVPVHTLPPAIAALRDVPGVVEVAEVVVVEDRGPLIYVYTTEPAKIPWSIEGIPIRTAPPGPRHR